MDLITNWINKTNNEISRRGAHSKDFDRFIQLYFLLNNVLKKSYDAKSDRLSASSDTGIMTQFLPKLIEVEWEEVKSCASNKKSFNYIYIGMQYYIETLLSKNFYADDGILSKNSKAFTELVQVGYFEEPTRFSYASITKADFDSFNKIATFGDFKQQGCKRLTEGTLKTIYAVRNNFYHGSKAKIAHQDELLAMLNLAMVKLLYVLFTVENGLSNDGNLYSLDVLKPVEEEYESRLKERVAKKLEVLYQGTKGDLDIWGLSVQENNSGALDFAYYFVMLDKLHAIIEQATRRKFRGLIKGLEYLGSYFELQHDGEISRLSNIHRNCKGYRNDIFHGNSSIDLGVELREKNNQLKELLRGCKSIIEEMLR